MCRSTMWAIKGLLAGVALGMAAGVAGSCFFRHNRRGVKRHIGRALRNIGDLADNMIGMF